MEKRGNRFGVLTAVLLMTGSIYTVILWHALNNGIALGLGEAGVIQSVHREFHAEAGTTAIRVLDFSRTTGYKCLDRNPGVLT